MSGFAISLAGPTGRSRSLAWRSNIANLSRGIEVAAAGFYHPGVAAGFHNAVQYFTFFPLNILENCFLKCMIFPI